MAPTSGFGIRQFSRVISLISVETFCQNDYFSSLSDTQIILSGTCLLNNNDIVVVPIEGVQSRPSINHLIKLEN